MEEEKVWFYSGDLKLEGIISINKGVSSLPAVVICHPHPLHGGNMNNNVVVAVYRGLSEKGVSALRFNFRGVQKSEGIYAGGEGEQADVDAAISFLLSREEMPVGKIGVCGYSFGSAVSVLAAVKNPRVQAIACISPPSLPSLEPLKNYFGTKLLVCGTEDEFIEPAELEKLVETMPEPKKMVAVRGADHFWQGFEEKLLTYISSFFSKALI